MDNGGIWHGDEYYFESLKEKSYEERIKELTKELKEARAEIVEIGIALAEKENNFLDVLSERDDLQRHLFKQNIRLAEARAEIERLQSVNAKIIANRDWWAIKHTDATSLIKQMSAALRLADDLIDEYAADYEHRDNVDEVRDMIKAALSAAERIMK